MKTQCLYSLKKPHNVQKQQGAALIMSLVILVILTLLGIGSMNTANLQNLMTGNAQYQTVALSTAEQAIREAERIVDGIVTGTPAPAITDGYHNIDGADAEVVLNNFTWPADQTANASAANSQYIIEYAGQKTLPPTSFKYLNGSSIAGDKVYVFRITARTTASRGAVRLVQSIYVTLNSPI